jgi:hypothetical protein
MRRMLPRSYESIWTGIIRAKHKKDNPPPYGNILSADTSIRVDDIWQSFGDGRKLLAQSLALSAFATTEKDKVLARQRMYNSHYIQVLNFIIEEGTFPESYRGFYKIPVTNAAVPDQSTEYSVTELSANIAEGELLMIAAGGHAIPFPLLLTITTNLAVLNAKLQAQSNAIDISDKAREDLKVLCVDGEIIVKKAWDEVETHYDEGTIESKRKNAREWGVLYVTIGNPVPITAHIVEMVLGAPVAIVGVKAFIADTEEVAYSISEGALLLKTTATGAVIITLSMDGFANKYITVEIDNSNPIDLGIIVMDKMVR